MMNYILVAIIICGALYIGFKFINGKKEQSFLGTVFTAGLSLISLASGNWQDTILKIVAIINNRNDINELVEDFNLFYFFFGAFLIIVAIILYFYSKRKIYVLNINGYMRQRIEPYLKKKKDIINDFREREINFVNIYNKIFCNRLDKESCECILAEIEEQVNAFKNETIERKRGYTGIAPIPFIMYAGTLLERGEINYYYEFDKIDTNDYYKLEHKKNKKYSKLNLKKQS